MKLSSNESRLSGGSMHIHRHRRLPAVLAVVALTLTSCAGALDEAGADSSDAEPATVERIAGTTVSRITLTELAAERLGIETSQVHDAPTVGRGPTGGRVTNSTVIPYSAVIYDPQGRAWTYTSPESLVFVRERIVVDRIVGDSALLVRGPAPGTRVVTVGASELWGTEYEVGE
jgi:hypothetical protein